MRWNRHKLLTTIGLAALAVVAGDNSYAQQKVQFTQYMFNTMIINPAYAGAEEALSMTFIQRSQWAGIENAPTTQTLSAHTLFKKKHFGLGATLINDKIGVHKNLSAMTNYAYRLRVGAKSYLSMGLQAGIHNRRSDYASLVGQSSNDPKLYNPMIAETYFDFGMGLYFKSERLDFGVSAPEMLPKVISVNDTISLRLNNVNYFVFTRYRIRVSDKVVAEPSILLKYLSGVPLSFDCNLNFVFRKVLTTGVSYRNKESVDFLLKGQVTPQLQFGYAYDHAIGEISRISNGSHEVMVNYLFRYAQKNVASPR